MKDWLNNKTLILEEEEEEAEGGCFLGLQIRNWDMVIELTHLKKRKKKKKNNITLTSSTLTRLRIRFAPPILDSQLKLFIFLARSIWEGENN